jgi:hypothetical protein
MPFITNVAKQDNTALGYYAMRYANSNSDCRISYNTAVGAYALLGSTTAASNTGISVIQLLDIVP